MTDPTHSYRNTKTGRVRLFFFRATEHVGIWDLVTPEGQVIGTWHRNSRLYQMVDGLSNHVIERLGEKEEPSGYRRWVTR